MIKTNGAHLRLKHMRKAAGFKVNFVKHIGYVKKSGEILKATDEGALFVKAIKE